MKPRVFRRHGIWICKGGGFGRFASFIGQGETPSLAYRGWVLIREANRGNKTVGLINVPADAVWRIADMKEWAMLPIDDKLNWLDTYAYQSHMLVDPRVKML